MKVFKRFMVIVLTAAMTIGGAVAPQVFPSEIETVYAAAKINKSELTLEVGKTAKLKIKGTKKKAKWSSDNEAVATVNKKGKVTGVSGGTATITATAGKKSFTCAVTVSGGEEENLVSVEQLSYESEKGSVIYYKLTNVSGEDIGFTVSATEKTASGEEHKWGGSYAYVKAGSYILLELMYPDSVSATYSCKPFKANFIGYDEITYDVKTQGDKMLVTATNNGDKYSDFVIDVLGYDEEGNLVYIYMVNHGVFAGETKEWEYDLPKGTGGVQIAPARYETELIAFTQG